jgi:hypothetical protein
MYKKSRDHETAIAARAMAHETANPAEEAHVKVGTTFDRSRRKAVVAAMPSPD